MKKFILGTLVMFALVGCTFTANINGEIKTDSNFAKLPQEAVKFNECITKTSEVIQSQTPGACVTFLAKEDKVITNMQVVTDVLPQLPQYLNKFGAISWDNPIGRTTETEDENLYMITGSTTMDGETVYVKYNFVQQNGELKVWGVYFSKTPIEASFAQ